MPSGHIADCAVFTAIMPTALRLRRWLMPHKLTRVHFSTSSHKIAANRNARIAVGGRGLSPSYCEVRLVMRRSTTISVAKIFITICITIIMCYQRLVK